MEDRRRSPRFPIRVELKLLAPEQHMLLLSHTVDLSLAGALVRANREIPVGARVRVSLYREDPYYPLQLEAEVVRVADGDAQRFPGLGLRFGSMTDADRTLLGEMIARRANIELESLEILP
ncbi:MAG: PilZ domain-containing protein [Myxococcales bacterium]|nr:PilZ domain-containing protein [Myxococcales bacterium]MCB9704234.1 PilZ domain-containing protein [Myxococcales bacterium]